MTAILDLPEVRQRVSPLSVEQYHRLDEYNENGKRTELIRGILIEKMSKSPLRASISTRLFKRLNMLIPAGFTVRQEQPLTFQDSEPEPDVAIIAGNDRDFEKRHPCTAALVIEVAVSSAALDRENASLYAEANVLEYWIVLGQERQVEVYRQPANGAYREKKTFSSNQTIDCGSVPGVRVALDELFA